MNAADTASTLQNATLGAVVFVAFAVLLCLEIRTVRPKRAQGSGLFELHPHDVYHRRYLTEQAMGRGLRASARRAGALTVPASVWLTEDHAAGALTLTFADRRRLQVRALASYGQPFRRHASNLVRVFTDGDGADG